MSTQTHQLPERYRPATRLVDDKDRLAELYCHRNLSIREIADEYANVSRASVGRAVREYGLTTTTDQTHSTVVSSAHGTDETGGSAKRTATDNMDPPDWGKLT